MRLLSKLNRRIGDKVYRTWYIPLSTKTIDKLGWPWGQELDVEVDENALIIRPRGLPRNAPAARQTGKSEDISDNTG